MKKGLLILVLILGCSSLKAQNYFGLMHAEGYFANLHLNANPHLNRGTDYLTSLRGIGLSGPRVGILFGINVPLFSQSGFDIDFRIGISRLIEFSDDIKSISGLSWNFSRTSDTRGRYYHYGLKLDLLPGYYSENHIVSSHLAFDYRPLIHYSPSALTLSTFEDRYEAGFQGARPPKRGLYYQDFFQIQTGIAYGHVQNMWNFNLIGGWQFHPGKLGIKSFPELGILPFYGSANLGYLLVKFD